MKLLTKTLWSLIYILPAVLFFSYHPVISFGANGSMNFELSLPLIWLVIFDVLSFILIIRLNSQAPRPAYRQPQVASRRKPQKNQYPDASSKPPFWRLQSHLQLPGLSDRRFFLLSLFPLYLTISIFWSANPLRGFLTAGIAWLIFFAVFSIIYLLPLSDKPLQFRRNLLLSILISSSLICIWCFVQSILDIMNIGREYTLLCRGCTYHSFGFPHPSGFAIEPQFMGNLLLAPTLMALYLVVFSTSIPGSKTNHSSGSHLSASPCPTTAEQSPTSSFTFRKSQRTLLILCAGFLSLTLLFTFSRGAIYAYAVALFILFIFALKHHQFRWSLIVIPVVSFLLSLSLQGLFAELGPTSETFVGGVTKSIHQLSLGLIDLRPHSVENSTSSVDNSVENVEKPVQKSQNPVENPVKSVHNLQIPVENIARLVQNSTIPSPSIVKFTTSIVENSPILSGKPVYNSSQIMQKPVNPVYISTQIVEKTPQLSGNLVQKQGSTHFDGYVAESTNIRLSLNSTAIQTWLHAPGHRIISLGEDCIQPDSQHCVRLSPSSILFGVGLGGAGTAMHAAYPTEVTSAKEIVQNQYFSLLLETGLFGVILALFGLMVCFCPQLFSRKFLDGRTAPPSSSSPITPSSKAPRSDFWHHPALPLLLSLLVAYVITLNFFSGLPNALQIYLMPPLLYLLFSQPLNPSAIYKRVRTPRM